MLAKRMGDGRAVSPRFISADELRLAEELAERLMDEVLPWQ